MSGLNSATNAGFCQVFAVETKKERDAGDKENGLNVSPDRYFYM